MAQGRMNDRDLISILAAILSIGREGAPEDFLQHAINLAVATGKYVDDAKLTTALRIRYEVATDVDCGTL